MRILHAVRDLDARSGGPSRSVTATAEYLSREGFECGVLYSRQKGEVFYRAGKVERFARHEIPGKVSASNLDAVLCDRQIDVLHIHGIWTRWLHHACVNASRRSIPYAIAPRGMLEPWAMKQKWLKKRLAWWTYQRRDLQSAARIHATSELEKQAIEALGIKTTCVVIPNGVEIPESVAVQPKSHDSGKRRVLFLSRLHPKKGADLLVEAWARVHPVGWECVIAGPDDSGYANEIQRLIAKYRLEGSVTVAPEIEDQEKWQAYRESSLFVLPSHSENFGLVVAEAFGAGLPVITTTKTPWARVNTDMSGWCVEDTIDAIASALREATGFDPQVLSEMGARGRAVVEREYSWGATATKLKCMYQAMGDARAERSGSV